MIYRGKNKKKNKKTYKNKSNVNTHKPYKITKKDYIEILNFYINKENKENKKTIKINPKKQFNKKDLQILKK